MNYKEFIEKWSTPETALEMREDLMFISDHQYQNTAVNVLSDIKGAELSLDSVMTYGGYEDGRIRFGLKGELDNGFVISYPKAVGVTEHDWYALLKIISVQALKTLK